MNFKKALVLILLLIKTTIIYCQITDAEKDSIYIKQVEDLKNPDKVFHAEPLYIDLIRDLGARKGEKEWNVGVGVTDNLNYDSYLTLVEYEWAPINRVGFEIELPFTFNLSETNSNNVSIPSNKLNSIKLATQWSFFVNEKYASSMAIGYINEFEFSDFESFGNPLIKGNIYNPFFVAAKRWGSNFHTLLYTGPSIEQIFQQDRYIFSYGINSNFHYMISGTKNFIGVEVNQILLSNNLNTVIRPQMRLVITDNILIGIVAGIPIKKDNERLSTFVRLIWEPKHKK